MYKKYSLLIVLFVLFSCGPIYTTNYSYFPPKEDSGRYCISSCSQQRQSCTSNCSDRNQTCEIAARSLDLAENITCNNRKNYCNRNPEERGCVFDKSMSCDNSSSSNNNFSITYSECKTDCLSYYNQCYINCGGKIQTAKICIHFCN